MRKFNLYLTIASVFVDAIAIFLGLLAAYLLRAKLAEAEGVTLFAWPFERYLEFILITLPLWLILFAAQGLYNPRELPSGWGALSSIIIGLISGWGAILIVLFIIRIPEAQYFPRLIIIYGLIATFLTTGLGRLILNTFKSWLYWRGEGKTKTVIITNSSAATFVEKLKTQPAHGRDVVGVIEGNYGAALSELKKIERVEEVIIASPGLNEKEILSILDWAELNNVSCSLIPSILSLRSTNLEVGSLAGTPIMHFKRSPLDGWGRVYKRILDLIIVTPLLILLFPVYLVLAFLVKLSSPGPIIYKEKRVGQDGWEFTVGKFRSMYADWRECSPNLKDWSADEATDPRVTPLGRIIRRTSLDELPQLWDVFIGKMSLVGPRPEQPKYVAEFAKDIPNYFKRHYIKSGLTGWAQINGLRGNTSIEERIKYDLYYIENWSIWFDLRIIVATVLLIMKQFLGYR